jgi:hypothetical protein
MRDRYTQQRFVVMQATTVYQTMTLGAVRYVDTAEITPDDASEPLVTAVGSNSGQPRRGVAHEMDKNILHISPKSVATH